jgi:hypothetical protein
MTTPLTSKPAARLLLALLAAASLGGCAVYPAPGYGPYESYNTYGQPYVQGVSPALISGSITYEQSFGGGGYYDNGRGYSRGYGGGRGRGDRDGDGIPNRFDRDRDGDGVRNRQDARANNRGRR